MSRTEKIPYLFAAAFALLLAVSCAGCGYTTRSAIADKYDSIYVQPFINRINIALEGESASKYRLYRPGLETEVTRAVKDRFLLDGNVIPVNDGSSDVTLKGELTEFRKDPLRYTGEDDEDVEEYRVNIVVNLSLVDNKTGKVIWKESGFTGDSSYFTSGRYVKSEEQSIRDATADLARRVVERTVEDW